MSNFYFAYRLTRLTPFLFCKTATTKDDSWAGGEKKEVMELSVESDGPAMRLCFVGGFCSETESLVSVSSNSSGVERLVGVLGRESGGD